MSPTGLGHGVYKDDVDYGVFCGEWCIGRIYQMRTGPADLRWFWALYAPSKPGALRTDNRTATLDEAKAEFETSWKQWKAWARWKRSTVNNHSHSLPTSNSSSRKPCAMPIMLMPPEISPTTIA
jgi:hypothetical protein